VGAIHRGARYSLTFELVTESGGYQDEMEAGA
jgi:hypothetical protein